MPKGRLAAVLVAVIAPGVVVAGTGDDDRWAARRAADLVRTLQSADREAGDQVHRFLLELRLKAPERFGRLKRAAEAQQRGQTLQTTLAEIERQETRANLMVRMLSHEARAEDSLRATLARMRRDSPGEYRRFKHVIDTYLTTFMEAYDAFGHSSLFRALSAAHAPRRGDMASVYATAMMQIGVLRSIFANVEHDAATRTR